MTSVVAAVRRRTGSVPLTALAAVGDLACIGVFVVVGSVNGHGVDPVAQAGRIAETYATFLAGWALLAVPAGLYAAETRRSARRALVRLVPAWAGAAVVAQLLRATPFVHGGAALTFYLVSVVVGLALLAPWRTVVARLSAGR